MSSYLAFIMLSCFIVIVLLGYMIYVSFIYRYESSTDMLQTMLQDTLYLFVVTGQGTASTRADATWFCCVAEILLGL